MEQMLCFYSFALGEIGRRAMQSKHKGYMEVCIRGEEIFSSIISQPTDPASGPAPPRSCSAQLRRVGPGTHRRGGRPLPDD
jgi:hypothetical protein